MSQARVYFSRFAARKGATLTCGNCRRPIEKGDQYRWFKVGFRARYKNIRCMRSECTPRASALESSKMADVYSAIESAEDALDALANGDPEENNSSINEAVQSAAEGIRAVADEYREAAEAMGDAGYEMEEKADALEQAADELESWESSESEPDLDHESHDTGDPDLLPSDVDEVDCDECTEARQTWWDEQVEEGRSALSDVELP